MKKFLTLIVLMFAFVAISNAQAVTMTGSGDSISNTGSKSCTYKVPFTPTAVTIAYTVTRASGTIAGKTILYGSVDGISYQAIDSFTSINVASNVKLFVVSSPKNFSYYKTTQTGTGTMKCYITAKILARKD